MDRIYVTKGGFDIMFSQCLPADVRLQNSEAKDRVPTCSGLICRRKVLDNIFAGARRLLGASYG